MSSLKCSNCRADIRFEQAPYCHACKDKILAIGPRPKDKMKPVKSHKQGKTEEFMRQQREGKLHYQRKQKLWELYRDERRHMILMAAAGFTVKEATNKRALELAAEALATWEAEAPKILEKKGEQP